MMNDLNEAKDLDKFLQKVNDLESIMKDLTSDDPERQAKAVKQADKKLGDFQDSSDRIGFDKTVINKKSFEDMNTPAPQQAPGPTFSEQQMDQKAFLNALEADSQRRAKARKERHRKANIIKEEGNVAYKNGEFEKSIELYTKAMGEARDLAALYTNRAAAYIQIRKYQEAVDDCDFSLRIDDKWIKAFVFKGRALQHMHKFDEAIEAFQTIAEIDEQKKKMSEGYIKEVLNAKRVHELESKAEISVKEQKPEAGGILKVINTLQSRLEDEARSGADISGSLMYYAGGLRVLQSQLTNEESRTLFRTGGGFSLLTHQGCISLCLRSRIDRVRPPHHAGEVVAAALGLCNAACQGLLENLEYCLALDRMPDMLLSFFDWPYEHVVRELITFLHVATLDEASRSVVYKTMDCKRFFVHLLTPQTRKADLNSSAAATAWNMSLDHRCRTLLQVGFAEDVLPCFDKYLREVGCADYEALTFRIRCLAQLLQNKAIIDQAASVESLKVSCQQAVARCVERFKSGLAHPCAMEELLCVVCAILRPSFTPRDCDDTIRHLTAVVLRSKGKDLLAVSLQVISSALEISRDVGFASKAVTKQLFKHAKQDDLRVRAYSLKVMCLIAQLEPKKLETWVALDKDYSVILSNLTDDSSDVTKINQTHVALIVGNLSAVPGALDRLDAGEVVRRLLVLCRGPDATCRANCAIALGKLAKADPRFLQALREHDGINILAKNKPPDELLQ